MRILVLYEELAWYFINCINEVAATGDHHFLVISKRPNSVAPFQFPFVHPHIELKTREELGHEQLLSMAIDFKPDGVFVGGWSHKPYLQLIEALKLKRSVVGFDNQWSGTFKQRLGSLYFRMFLKKHFSKAFVPGTSQDLFARHLGFKEEEITTGAYCCDGATFDGYYQKFRSTKGEHFPKRFLYVGRYAKEKAIDVLWDAFIEWQREVPSEWELWCLGKGDLTPPEHPKIKHFGFVQANKMDEIIRNTGVLVLPSRFEPWGVVVHEYATAGYPLLCSNKTGAASAFLENGKNGFLVEAGQKDQLKEKMNKFSTLKQNELVQMVEESRKKAALITPAIWAERFVKMFE